MAHDGRTERVGARDPSSSPTLWAREGPSANDCISLFVSLERRLWPIRERREVPAAIAAIAPIAYGASGAPENPEVRIVDNNVISYSQGDGTYRAILFYKCCQSDGAGSTNGSL